VPPRPPGFLVLPEAIATAVMLTLELSELGVINHFGSR
jgi:hypothetical protein